ncbi:hypothetical protein BH10PSE18_BH10PSE18_15250 [soil metagenome]
MSHLDPLEAPPPDTLVSTGTTTQSADVQPAVGGSYVRDPATGELTLQHATEAAPDRADLEPDGVGTARPAEITTTSDVQE